MFATANWFLILLLTGDASSASGVTQVGPFFSREACEAAGTVTYNQGTSVFRDSKDARLRPWAINYVCVPVPTEGD